MRALVTALIAVIMVVLGANSYATEDLLALTNADRLGNGFAPLTIASDLQVYAQGWAEEMMKARQVFHSSNLASVMDSRLVGENVGEGPTLTAIELAFMASPAHRANLLRPDYAEAGVGVVWDGENFWVAVLFRQAATAALPGPAGAEAKPAPAAPKANPAPAAPKANPTPTPPPTSSPPRSGRPEPKPAPRQAMSPRVEVPEPPPPSSTPAGVAHPASSAREADREGARLSWVLAATTGTSVPTEDAHGEASPAPVVEAHTGSAALDGSSPPLLMAVAILGMVYAWTRTLRSCRTPPVGSRGPG